MLRQRVLLVRRKCGSYSRTLATAPVISPAGRAATAPAASDASKVPPPPRSKPGVEISTLVGGAAALALLAGGAYYYGNLQRSAPAPRGSDAAENTAQGTQSELSEAELSPPPVDGIIDAAAAATPDAPVAPAIPVAHPSPDAAEAEEESEHLHDAKSALAELDGIMLSRQLIAQDHAAHREPAVEHSARAASEAMSSESSPGHSSASVAAAAAAAEHDAHAAVSSDAASEPASTPATGSSDATQEHAAPPEQPTEEPTAHAPVVAAPKPAPPAPEVTALASSREWLVDKMGALLSRDVAGGVVGAEVGALSGEELRERVLRLSAEMAQRGKWEALNLKALVEENDKQWMDAMRTFVVEKTAELEKAYSAALTDTKVALATENSEALRKEQARLSAALAEDAAAKMRSALQQLFGAVGEETEARLGEMSAMRVKLAAIEALLGSRASYDREAHRSHRITLALLALVDALNKPAPSSHEVAALLVAAEGSDPLVSYAVAMLPREGVHSAKGVPSLHTLQTRFAAVNKAARRAALTPESSGIIGQAVGAATAMLVVPQSGRAPTEQPPKPAAVSAAFQVPQPPAAVMDALTSARSFVANALGGSAAAGAAAPPVEAEHQPEALAAPSEGADAPEASPVTKALKNAQQRAKDFASTAQEVSADVQRVTSLFDAAQSAVEAGDLRKAVGLLTPLSGYAGEAVKDWIGAAKQRIACDEATALLRARAVVLAAALY